MSKRPIWLDLVCGSAILVVGICIGVWRVNWPSIELKKEIDVGALIIGIITIGTTFYLAWFISTVLERNVQNNRAEKDILLKRFDKIIETLDGLESKVVSTTIDWTDATGSLKRLSIQFSQVLEIANLCGNTYDRALIATFKNSVRDLKNLMTNSPSSLSRPRPGQDPIVVIGGKIIYSPARVTEIQKENVNLSSLAARLQISMNKG